MSLTVVGRGRWNSNEQAFVEQLEIEDLAGGSGDGPTVVLAMAVLRMAALGGEMLSDVARRIVELNQRATPQPNCRGAERRHREV